MRAGWADKLARTLGVPLASVAPSVWHGGGHAGAHARGPDGPVLTELELARAAQKAVALAQQEEGTLTRAEDDLRMGPDQLEWQITLFIQNASELPVEVHVAELAIDTWDIRTYSQASAAKLRSYTPTSEPGLSDPPTSSRERSRPGTNGTARRSTSRTATSAPSCSPGSASFS